MMCGLWVLAMLHSPFGEIVSQSIGYLSAGMAVLCAGLQFAQIPDPSSATAWLIKASELGIAFFVVFWALMVKTPADAKERAEERKAWADERATLFQRHEVERATEREECDKANAVLSRRIEHLESRIEALTSKGVQA
jgi:hypothetical protein